MATAVKPRRISGGAIFMGIVGLALSTASGAVIYTSPSWAEPRPTALSYATTFTLMAILVIGFFCMLNAYWKRYK